MLRYAYIVVSWGIKAVIMSDEIKKANELFAEGMRYSSGGRVKRDRVKAFELFTEAAELGHVEAQRNVGLCHKRGLHGKELNWAKAAEWLEKAAVQGCVAAAHDLGLLYFSPAGGMLDYKKAAEWFALAAEKGHGDAQNVLGKCYAEGKGVEKNYNTARKWWRKAVKQSSGEAKRNLEALAKMKLRNR